MEIEQRFGVQMIQIPLLPQEVKGLAMLRELGEMIFGKNKGMNDAIVFVQIIGAPIACKDGVKDTWREVAIWAENQLKRHFGTAVQVKYYDLFDSECPKMLGDARLPLVFVKAGFMEIIMLSVIRPSDVPLPETINREGLEYWRWYSSENLNVAKMALEGKGLRVITQVEYGNSVEQILRVADEEMVDLIVLGALEIAPTGVVLQANRNFAADLVNSPQFKAFEEASQCETIKERIVLLY